MYVHRYVADRVASRPERTLEEVAAECTDTDLAEASIALGYLERVAGLPVRRLTGNDDLSELIRADNVSGWRGFFASQLNGEIVEDLMGPLRALPDSVLKGVQWEHLSLREYVRLWSAAAKHER